MKPIRLIMEAFGSYDERTVIPFGELDHGLYLITGDTGAGKTTIFDAIMFALYGAASGTDRKDMSRLHCDFSDMSKDTFVEFTFLHNGKEYKVTRRIHFRRKRGSRDEYSGIDFPTELFEPGKPVTEGTQKVNNRCAAILGINEDQFRKIVMLAQGEFRSFLKAGSGEKSEILNKLFDNSPVRYYQQLLEKTREAALDRRRRLQEKLEEALKDGFVSGEASPEERARFQSENPELERNMTELIALEEKEAAVLREQAEKLRQEEGRLRTERGAAEGINDRFDRLKKAEDHRRELEALRESTERLRQETEEVARAWRQVRPVMRECRSAERMLQETEEDIRKLTESLAAAEQRLNAAELVMAGDEKNRSLGEELRRKAENLREQLPRYRELTELEKEHDGILRRIGERSASLQGGREREEALVKRLEELKQALQQSEGIEGRVAGEKSRLDQLNRDLTELAGPRGILSGVLSAGKEEGRLLQEEQALKMLTEKASAAMDRQRSIYQRYIQAQAGIMAGELRTETEREGKATCPVCGSTVCRDLMSCFASMPEDAPRAEDVEESRAALEKAEAERQDKQERIRSGRSVLDTVKRNLEDRAAAVLEESPDFASLSDGVFLRARIGQLQERKNEGEKALAEAQRGLNTRKLAMEEQGRGEKELLEIRQGNDRIREEITGLEKAKTRTETSLAEIRRLLSFPGEKEAGEQVSAWGREIRSLEEQLKAHQKERDGALELKNRVQGSLTGRKQEKPRRQEELEGAQEKLRRTLEAAGFPDAQAAERLLSLPGDQEGEAWIGAREKRVRDYENDVRETEKRIAEYRKELEGKERKDLAALDLVIEERKRMSMEAQEKLNRASEGLNRRKTARDRVNELLGEMARGRKGWERIDRLGNLAHGVVGTGGMLSFERYVMGALLREVLEMANRRISVMSDGRYELIHQAETNQQNRIAGLEIEVLDHETGRSRPSSSLSGGEGFYASLSLALGLSDVVQAQAGGQRLDALFIDEGFGSLSEDVLGKALEVLNQLTEGNRLVGIISHVEKLSESIPRKISIYNDAHGSHRREGFD